VFAALTISLNLSPAKIPAPYAPYLIYQIWEIPIVAAFLLFGVKVGMGISILNTATLLLVFPGELPTGPFYNLAAVLSMLFGVVVVQRLVSDVSTRQGTMLPVISTAMGTLFRVGGMTLVNWACLPFPPPVGFGLPTVVVMASLPIIGFFNATIALYTIPVGYFLARIVKPSMKTFM
jgi:riboflavin transporter FmnP